MYHWNGILNCVRLISFSFIFQDKIPAQISPTFFFFFWPLCVACGILVPWPGIKPVLLAFGVQSFNHCTICYENLGIVSSHCRYLLPRLIFTSKVETKSQGGKSLLPLLMELLNLSLPLLAMTTPFPASLCTSVLLLTHRVPVKASMLYIIYLSPLPITCP